MPVKLGLETTLSLGLKNRRYVGKFDSGFPSHSLCSILETDLTFGEIQRTQGGQLIKTKSYDRFTLMFFTMFKCSCSAQQSEGTDPSDDDKNGTKSF